MFASPLLPAADAWPRPPKTMVALGDSFASGPLIPVGSEQPTTCFRSSNNYAHQVARSLALQLVDMTCSGAETVDMRHPQVPTPENYLDPLAVFVGDIRFDYEPKQVNPPQFTALRKNTDVVTLQIGGNDIGFLDLALTCGQGEFAGPGCKEAVAAKKPFEQIKATAPKIASVLKEIHRRSPHAKIYVLGYSGIFKIGKNASCPAMAAGEEDARYLRSVQEALNRMIRSVADSGRASYSRNAQYVDVYTPSEGHTACDLPAIRWLEPIVPVNAAFPAHPNLGGMSAIRKILVPEIWPHELLQPNTPPEPPVPPDPPA